VQTIHAVSVSLADVLMGNAMHSHDALCLSDTDWHCVIKSKKRACKHFGLKPYSIDCSDASLPSLNSWAKPKSISLKKSQPLLLASCSITFVIVRSR